MASYWWGEKNYFRKILMVVIKGSSLYKNRLCKWRENRTFSKACISFFKAFPGKSMDKLQKSHVREIQSYISWKKKQCKEEPYALQIKKCMDLNCRTPTKLNQEELKWLPMLILDSSNLHYLLYDEAKLLKKADKRDRPSLKIRKETSNPKILRMHYLPPRQ